MKVEVTQKKIVISDESGTLSADATGLTTKQRKQLSRQMQVAFLEGKRDEAKKAPAKKKTKKKATKKKEE